MAPFAIDRSNEEETGSNPVVMYQVDSSKKSRGRTVAMTKQTFRWRYGYANSHALRSGVVGAEARGSEHDVVLIWSISSGKRVVFQDGKQIHSSKGRRVEGKFHCSWSSNDNVFTIVAFASKPLGPSSPNWKQYELLINGRPFSNFSRIYELGLLSNIGERSNLTDTRHSVSTSKILVKSRVQRDHEMERNVPRNHSRENSPHSVQSEQSSIVPRDLLSDGTASHASHDLLSAPEPAQLVPTSVYYNASQPTDAFNPKPRSYDHVCVNILDAYKPTVQNAMSISSYSDTQFSDISTSASSSLHINTHEVKYNKKGFDDLDSPTDVTALEIGVKNLVNLDDISQPVLKSYESEFLKSKQKVTSAKMERLPLSALKKIGKTGPPTKEIMKSHHAVGSQSYSRDLVVYGQQLHGHQYNNYSRGPPPLQFGQVTN